ncbi:chlorophyllase/cutinase-like alpha/beta fold protein [uncultured Clostridium sp.]|uniref:poly(ethylene terephthalate) hydrolase family protein n=1 Tax=uncultured Clostridium sp. TaxID=59620 RepID=UPI00261501C2|nr:alpha/beta hydrolase [uncultured Clostridium sp.]
MKKIFKVIGVMILIIILLFIGLIFIISFVPAVPKNYTNDVKTGGDIEKKYIAMGSYDVKDIKIKATELTKYNYVYYPEELETADKEYPVVIVLNGTGILPEKYKALFKHLASWGFIVVGNDDGSTGFGKSADETMDYIIKENSDENSVFYRKIDLNNIGITGHSQGVAGVFTTISVMWHKDKYKTAVALSPTHEKTALSFGWNYDLTKINIPVLMIAGTQGDFETKLVIPIENMIDMHNKIPSSKVMMRRIGAEHGQMLYSSDGYVTAWFMWKLQDDEEASKAFIGDNPEILNNKFYQDQKITLNINETLLK